MKKFKGFSDQESFTQVPDTFFQELLGSIKDPLELKVTLYFLWRIAHMENQVRGLTPEDILTDAPSILTMDSTELKIGLELAVERGSLLSVQTGDGPCYLLNSPRGRAAAGSVEDGDLELDELPISAPPRQKPNIFALYEKNIGPLTPMLADALKDAEQIYSPESIDYAFQQAVKNNKRHWKYVEAVLRHRKEAEDAKKQTRRDTEKDRRRYIEGKYADFIEH